MVYSLQSSLPGVFPPTLYSFVLVGKLTRHGLGMEWAKMGLAKRIGVDLQEATRVYNQYKIKYKITIF